MARSRIARLFPTLPPSASSASGMAAPHKRNPDVAEGGRDRGVWLVYRDAHRSHAWKSRKHGVGRSTGGSLDQAKALGAKRFAHAIDDLVGARRGREVDLEVKIDDKGLPHLGFVRHHAVVGVKSETFYENPIAHRAASMAAATRSACTVSATSCARMIAAPFSTASRWAEIEPPMRSSGVDGVTVLMNRFRDAPTSRGKPKHFSSARRAMQVMLCSGVLPKPIPGSRTIHSRVIPARAAISKECEKKSITSATMSMVGSADSRLCITMTGTPRLATRDAISGSRCRPHTSLTIAAPWSSAQAAIEALMVSIDTGTPIATTAGNTVASRVFSSSADTGTGSP